MSKPDNEQKKRGRPPKIATKNVKKMVSRSEDDDSESEIDSPVREHKNKPVKDHSIDVPRKVRHGSEPRKVLMCTDCHNVHQSSLVNVLSSAEYEIQRLKKESDSLTQRLKDLSTIDIVQLLAENAKLKINVIT